MSPSITTLNERSYLELVTVYEIGRILGASLDIDRTFRAALNVLTAHLGLTRAMVVLPHGDGEGTLRVHSWAGLDREQAERGQWAPGEGVIGRVFSRDMAVVVPDVANAPEFIDRTGAFSPRPGHLLAFVVVPLKADKSVLGVLAAQREVEGRARLTDDQRILTMVGTLLAQAIALNGAVRTEHERLLQETTRLQKALAREPRGRFALDNVVGDSAPMQQVFREVHQAAPSRATVLLRGESGTGKEAVARAIHFLSPRKDAPFVKVNCAALTESLLESELFGHEKGAFTGAAAQRKGRIENAAKGTLFLDEIGDVPLPVQVKLLRFLQEQTIERVGGRQEMKVDTRILAATNADLEAAMRSGRFREDFFYRLAVVRIQLPPLRARGGDITLVARAFLHRYAVQNARPNLLFSQDALRAIERHPWPGNIRELQNRVRRAVIMAEGNRITPHDLELASTEPAPGPSLKEAREDLEREMVQSALRRHGGKISPAALELGISRPTLYDLMERYGVDKASEQSA